MLFNNEKITFLSDKKDESSKESGKIYCFASPGKYLQGQGLLDRLPEYAQHYGTKVLYIITNSLFEQVSSRLSARYPENDTCCCALFQGACCEKSASEFIQIAERFAAEVVVGIGGGNLMDTAKIVSGSLNLPLILMPSVVSCDAATSAMSVLYDENGIYIGALRLPKRADMIAVDTDLILRSPRRLFISGIGDALATYFEARAGSQSGALNYIDDGYRSCCVAQIIARATFDVLIAHGREALEAFSKGIINKALDEVIENNVYLSGLAFENTSCAVAHGLHGALGFFATKKTYHGEKVAFGLLCQMILENCPAEEFQAVLELCRDIGLPTALDDFGIEADHETAVKIAEYAVQHSSHLKNEPFAVTVESLAEAIIKADAVGQNNKR